MAIAKAMVIILSIYVCCLESEIGGIFHIGDDIQVAQARE